MASNIPDASGNPSKILHWLVKNPSWTLVLATLLGLMPFLAKPFNIDDPLFIWVARQIAVHPFDPYGFKVNWYGAPMWMWQATENPPLSSYYLAVVAAVLGWSEVALHAAMLLPAVAVILGTWRLARQFCSHPLLVALITLFTPGFLVSSTTIMCDVMMLAFWVWAVVYWMEGLEQKSNLRLVVSGCLIALATLTKYYGLCLVPLLAVYTLVARKRLDWRLVWLLIPVGAIAWYQWQTHMLYGKALFSGATEYVSSAKSSHQFSLISMGLITLAFGGACAAPVIFFISRLWRSRMLAALVGACVIICCADLLWHHGHTVWERFPAVQSNARWLLFVQFTFWLFGGVVILALTLSNLRHLFDAKSWLLALWVGGTFIFTANFNWTINARSLLPMIPAVGILLVRQLERTRPSGFNPFSRGVLVCLGISAGLAWLTAQADFQYAVAVRQAVQGILTNRVDDRSPVWFEGHWGFQYYMEKDGALAVNLSSPSIQPGDVLVVHLQNTGFVAPDVRQAIVEKTLAVAGPHWLSTWNRNVGAGFYSANLGPLPFAFGSVSPEQFVLYRWQTNPPPLTVSPP